MRREHPLSGVDRDLRVSPRRRLELIEELGADTEALREELERRGYGPAQARHAAMRQLVPTGETLAQLETQHAPPLGRWVRAAGWLDRAERLGIAVAVTLAGAAACIAIRWPGPLGATAALAWPQVIVVALLAGNWTLAAKRLWVDGDLRPEPRRRLWARHAGLIVVAVALGALGAAWEAHSALGALESGAVPRQAAWEAVRRSVSFAALGLVAAVFGLFGWLAITPRLIHDEAIERRISAFFAGPSLTLASSTSSTSSNGRE